MVRKITRLIAFGLLVLPAVRTNEFRPYAAEQPDQALFSRAMQLFVDGRHQEARTLLETLVASYPDSEYGPRAGLALDDFKYADGIGPRREPPSGGVEVTFFPSLKETQGDKK